MVRLIPPHECDCKTCNGGDRAPEGTFGGSHCLCTCHDPTPKDDEFQSAMKKALRSQMTPSVPDSADDIAYKFSSIDWACSTDAVDRYDRILEAVTAFGRAQYERGLEKSAHAELEAHARGRLEGQREGIEKAAEVCDTLASHENHFHVYSTAEVIKRRILALLPKEGAKG